MKIKKDDLSYLLNKVMNGVGNNKLIPISSYLGIKIEDNVLTLCGTNGVEYIYSSKIINDQEESIQGNICVKADLFYKLISKTTTNEIQLDIKEDQLIVLGNGEYNIPILYDNEGRVLEFPLKQVGNNVKEEVISVEKFKNLKFYCEKSLSNNPENKILNGYYSNNEISLSTNKIVMASFNEGILNEPFIFRKSFVDLVINLNNDIIINRWTIDGIENIYASDGETEIYSIINCNINDYPTDKVQRSLSQFNFSFIAKISLKELSSAIDRLSIFNNEGSSVVITLQENNLLHIEETISHNWENIKLLESSDLIDWSGKLDIDLLNEQIKSFKNDEINIYLGNDIAIKLCEKNITKLICLMRK